MKIEHSCAKLPGSLRRRTPGERERVRDEKFGRPDGAREADGRHLGYGEIRGSVGHGDEPEARHATERDNAQSTVGQLDFSTKVP